LIILSTLTITASPSIVLADDTNPPIAEINRLPDGTTLFIDHAYGYRFIPPTGWYPISLPSPEEEIEHFNKLAAQNNLPFDKGWIASLSAEVLRFVVVDLDSKHYENERKEFIAAPTINVTKLMPGAAVAPLTGLIRLSSLVTGSKIIKNSDQEVGVVEFASSPSDDAFFGGKMVLFIRFGKLFAIVGITNKKEVVPDITTTIDQLLDSLVFFDSQ